MFQNRLGGKNGFDFGIGEPANQIKIMNVHVAEDTATAFNELPGAWREIVCGHGQRIQSANFTGVNLLFHFLNVFIKASLKTNLQRGTVFCCRLDGGSGSRKSCGNWLFAKDRLAVGKYLGKHLLVGGCSNGDHEGIRLNGTK